MAKGLVGVSRFVNEDDYLDPGVADKDPMLNELFRPEGFRWAAGFIENLPHGDLAVYQTLLARPDADGRIDLPLTRRDWYAG